MTMLSPLTLAREVAAMAAADRRLLSAIAGVFILLPQLSALLLLPPAPVMAQGQATTAFVEATLDWWRANAVPLLGFMLLSMAGQGAIVALLLDRAQPTVGQAIVRGAAALPFLFVATLLTNLAVFGGLLLLIVPGLYLIGRTFLLASVVVAEGWRNPLAAAVRTVRLTRGHGWMLLALQAVIWLVIAVLAGLPGALMRLAETSPALGFVAALAQAALLTLGTLVPLLLQIAAYRRLAA